MTLRIWSEISPFLLLGSSEKIWYIGTSEDTNSFVWERGGTSPFSHSEPLRTFLANSYLALVTG